jgi:hypothetical protein
MSNPRFILELEPKPGDTVPCEIRLRRALKTLWRCHGFRCVDVKQVNEQGAQVDHSAKGEK